MDTLKTIVNQSSGFNIRSNIRRFSFYDVAYTEAEALFKYLFLN